MDLSSAALDFQRSYPRYWMPSKVAALAVDKDTFKKVLSYSAHIAVGLGWMGLLGWNASTLPDQPVGDLLLLIGLVWVAHLVFGTYLPSILLNASSLRERWVGAGRLPLPTPDVSPAHYQWVERCLREHPQAGPVLLGWLVAQKEDTVCIAHLLKLANAKWETLDGLPVPSTAWTLGDIQGRARAQKTQQRLESTLKQAPQVPKRPRL